MKRYLWTFNSLIDRRYPNDMPALLDKYRANYVRFWIGSKINYVPRYIMWHSLNIKTGNWNQSQHISYYLKMLQDDQR